VTVRCPRCGVRCGTRYEPRFDMPSLLGTVGVENDDIVLAGEYIHSNISYLALSTYT
jgi:hypothetical protein